MFPHYDPPLAELWFQYRMADSELPPRIEDEGDDHYLQSIEEAEQYMEKIQFDNASNEEMLAVAEYVDDFLDDSVDS